MPESVLKNGIKKDSPFRRTGRILLCAFNQPFAFILT